MAGLTLARWQSFVREEYSTPMTASLEGTEELSMSTTTGACSDVVAKTVNEAGSGTET